MLLFSRWIFWSDRAHQAIAGRKGQTRGVAAEAGLQCEIDHVFIAMVVLTSADRIEIPRTVMTTRLFSLAARPSVAVNRRIKVESPSG
ncbi:hypothetical protein DAA51_02610 [Bradyrhizobium sp. WBAH10]|nr:hypothetical protein [Bradyrhizobium sp. WBAH30]MDD1546216.1 hypothetical protein [Bradyrhizobium sp. WBAH41]MDD1559803.1 hypothetical protein [Bradyrhizobium sp. WBAH23]MDD1567511.1 hypothetical protein [Bradyrhizobium sp. WBAH33]MDD1593213.1 hypothetical protein [Bradyrhizobium sp. WBAH42]NRB90707.1 hypothetical protein [Bradyrhizobium sp. WBAH10]QCJ87720.1 hypothetical protein DAA57_03720 [Bradyrhizobium yuanmingense]